MLSAEGSLVDTVPLAHPQINDEIHKRTKHLKVKYIVKEKYFDFGYFNIEYDDLVKISDAENVGE